MAKTVLHVLGHWMFQLVFEEKGLRELRDESGKCHREERRRTVCSCCVMGRSIEKERWSRWIRFMDEVKHDADSESSPGTSFACQKGGVRRAEGRARIQSSTCMALGSDW